MDSLKFESTGLFSKQGQRELSDLLTTAAKSIRDGPTGRYSDGRLRYGEYVPSKESDEFKAQLAKILDDDPHTLRVKLADEREHLNTQITRSKALRQHKKILEKWLQSLTTEDFFELRKLECSIPKHQRIVSALNTKIKRGEEREERKERVERNRVKRNRAKRRTKRRKK